MTNLTRPRLRQALSVRLYHWSSCFQAASSSQVAPGAEYTLASNFIRGGRPEGAATAEGGPIKSCADRKDCELLNETYSEPARPPLMCRLAGVLLMCTTGTADVGGASQKPRR